MPDNNCNDTRKTEPCTAFISSFAYCELPQDEHETTNNFTLLPFIKLNSVPERISIKAICSLFGDNFFNDNSVRFLFKDIDGRVLVRYDWLLQRGMLEATGGKIPDALIFHFIIECNIEKTGIYTTEILINDETIGQYKIHAVVRRD